MNIYLSENEVLSSIQRYFRKLKTLKLPIFVDRRQAGGFSYKYGIPDLYIVFAGIHIEIEVKATDKTARASQEKWAERFKLMLVPYICVDNVDDLKIYLAAMFPEYAKELL